MTEGLPRVLVVPTKEIVECAPWWAGGCGRLNADGTTTPTEFLSFQQAIFQARADQSLRHGVDDEGRIRVIKSVPAFVGVHGCIHPDLESDGSFKPFRSLPQAIEKARGGPAPVALQGHA